MTGRGRGGHRAGPRRPEDRPGGLSSETPRPHGRRGISAGMSENIVQLHQEKPSDSVAPSLRRLADMIEAGEHGDFPVTTCVVLIGHTDAEVPGGGEHRQANYWATFGYGPRCDSFTVRGLMATCLRDWGHDG